MLSFFLEGFVWLVSYITNTSVFPKPLKPEEEAKLLAQMEGGHEGARQILIERNLRLVAHIVKKFANTAEDNEDLISIGTIGLIKAIRTYDSGKQTRLATYAARCIENEILMHLRSNRKSRGEILLQDPIGSDKEGNEISLLDILSSDMDVAERVEMKVDGENLRQKLKGLSARERKVLELRYGLIDGIAQTQREISKTLGISRSYVSRIEKRAISKLQEEMIADGCP